MRPKFEHPGKADKTNQYDKKIFRLLYILNKLDTERRISTSEMAMEFNVTPRTVQRDIELLSMTGFPLVSLEKGVHTFTEGFSLKKLMLSTEEASLISFLYEIAKSLGENFEDSFRDIFKKVLSPGRESVYYAKVPEGIKISDEYRFLGDMEKSVKEHQKISLIYVKADKETKYKIKPLKLVFYDGFWYLLAYLDRAYENWILKFRLDRIKEMNATDEYFHPPANLKTLLDQSVNIWFSKKEKIIVNLKVSKDVAHYFMDKHYFPYQKIKKTNKDGSLILETKVSHHMEVVPTIFTWLPNIIVISPKKFRQETKEIVSNYLKSLK